jgi:pimeloyl-ACP methyl ester carboxylesterase
MTDYTRIDQSPLLYYLFYPRKIFTAPPLGTFDFFVPVEGDISVSCRFYAGNNSWPWILFFHGNGEVISDYDSIFPFYHHRGLNLIVTDYRGYGASGGMPNLTNLINDAHTIFKAIQKELPVRKFKEDLWVMGRSLGSISALELAYHYPESIKGLIIESGFISVVKLIRHPGPACYRSGPDKNRKRMPVQSQ